MPRLSAIDAIGPAFERTNAMLFRPFRFRTWLKIGFIGWLAGASTFSASFNYQIPSVPGGKDGPGRAAEDVERMVRTFLSEHWPWIVAAVVLLIVVGLVFLYLSCRFRFILFDSVLQHDAQIGRGWGQYRSQAHRYLIFLAALALVLWTLLALTVGLPLWRAYKAGVLSSENPFPEFLRIFVPAFLGIFIFVLASAIIMSLANDFGVPLLALDNLTIGSASSALSSMIRAEPGAFAGYMGMKLLLSIAAGIVVAIPLFVVLLVLLVPAIILVILIGALLKGLGAAGLAIGAILAVIGGLAAVALIVLVTMLASAPLAVFFTSYALYFFGGRYPKLGTLVWPAPAPIPPTFPGIAPPPPSHAGISKWNWGNQPDYIHHLHGRKKCLGLR